MQRNSLLITGFVIVLLVALLYLYNYYAIPEEITLSEPQIIACHAAEEGGTCFTKLPELDLVSPRTCCQVLEVCCK